MDGGLQGQPTGGRDRLEATQKPRRFVRLEF